MAGACAAMIGVFVGGLAQPASAQTENAEVSIVHGIPGTPVDVYVDGERTLDNLEPETVAGPLSLPAGDYDVKIVAADAPNADAPPVLEPQTVAVESGQNVSLVAHLIPDGRPALTPFVNDTGGVAAGDARLVVRHTAAAPPVDVRADGEAIVSDLANPDEATTDVPAGTVSADVVLAGESDPVIGPTDLDLRQGTATIVYAVGSAEDDSLGVVTQTLTNLGSTPDSVPGGIGTQQTQEWLPVAIGLGMAGLVLVALSLLTRSRAAAGSRR
ncbi:MAG TPA: DUF4397 domain-containing protein [Actinopolymorphaceae bacterium]